jgi:hypothetical protein
VQQASPSRKQAAWQPVLQSSVQQVPSPWLKVRHQAQPSWKQAAMRPEAWRPV